MCGGTSTSASVTRRSLDLVEPATEAPASVGVAAIASLDAAQALPRPLALRLLVSLEQLIGAALVAALFFFVLAQVVSRYVFGRPLVWSEELARFTLVWLTFVGAAFVMAYRRHIVVSFFKLSDRAWLALETISSVVMITVALVVLPAGVEFVQSNVGVVSPAAGVPLGWIKASALVGFALLAIHVAVNLVVAFRYGREAVEAAGLVDQRAST